MSNKSSQVSRKTVTSPGSARRSKRLLRNLKTPPIPLPSMSPDVEDVSITPNQKKKNRKVEYIKFKWVDGKKMNFEVNVPEYEFYTQQEHVLTPVEYFKRFFSDDLFEVIVEQTNLYSVTKSGRSINLTVNELQDFLSIELWMGVAKLPAYTDYWSNLMSYEKVSNIMPLNKYQKILKNLHFNNNDEYNEDDQFYKVKPIIDIIRRNCLNQEQGKRFSIDEMMVPYKGKKAGSRRQYVKSKPKKWGFKLFVRSGINGIVYDFFPYCGENTFNDYHFSEYENKFLDLDQKLSLH